ncbi:MAG TPA: isoprenoid biosynthesis glyoxalase ElbB [Gemmatales bacterium]|nr:isoprenoid biosynthesis glyoxalase ElbB [Gemmatales bacterium]HMP17173.1 isoprenoid biosynthesis glyoxalase ElbB [Gemmatales bacterium]
MARVAVILSGAGVYDGSEIYETVLTLIALDKAGAAVTCLAPDKNLLVINHLTGEPAGDERNVLVESARIVRGKVSDLAKADPADFDAVILPGGYGAAKNLCNYARAGAKCEVDPSLRKFLTSMNLAGKPIGAICIAPVILAKVLGTNGSPKLTIGTDPDTANHIESLGAEHISCPVDDVVIDAEQKVVTTPAYMLAHRIGEAAQGINKLVHEVMKLAQANAPRRPTL